MIVTFRTQDLGPPKIKTWIFCVLTQTAPAWCTPAPVPPPPPVPGFTFSAQLTPATLTELERCCLENQYSSDALGFPERWHELKPCQSRCLFGSLRTLKFPAFKNVYHDFSAKELEQNKVRGKGQIKMMVSVSVGHKVPIFHQIR